ncbi:hypothetical protein A2U01_0071641, partial [Trifolium medium]|nr:hypothetical protein [Trifolium medium]
MGCTEENKTILGVYVLREEANVWWKNVKLRIGADDVKNKKVIEFMELKQGNLSVAEYSAKFEA